MTQFRILITLLLGFALVCCGTETRDFAEGDGDSDGDSDADGDSDSDSYSDAGGDADGDSDGDGDGDGDGDSDADYDAEEDVCEELWCTPRWSRVFPGTFTMGSPPSELGRDADETQHEVTLTHGFLIQTTEVTQYQFHRLMGYDPTSEITCDGDCPVGNVSWSEAASYCNELSAEEGLELCYFCDDSNCELRDRYSSPYGCLGYRLPTEAEWEYAARANDSRATHNGALDAEHLECEDGNETLDPIAWFCGNVSEPGIAQPVGQLRSNQWGLYDMLGNRLEATHDWHAAYPTHPVTDPFGPDEGTRRLYRGGNAWAHARFSRAASREAFDPDDPLNLGFRPVRTVAE